MNKTRSIFIYSAGGLLLAMGWVTLVGAFQESQRLGFLDPILGVTTKHLMTLIGISELLIAVLCLFTYKWKAQLTCVLWVASNLGLYQIAMKYCTGRFSSACMSNWTGPLQIHPASADLLMFGAILYLFLGSVGAFWATREKATLEKRTANELRTVDVNY